MKMVMDYIKKHAKAFILSAIMLVVTFGLWGLYKFYKKRKGL